MILLFGALVGHLVGDFLLQNDYLAQGKKVSDLICALHVFVYSCSVFLFSGWWYDMSLGSGSMAVLHYISKCLILFLAIAVPHFLIDRTDFVKRYMVIMGQDDFAKPPMAPWSMIVVDQCFHVVCLYLTCFLMGVLR